MREGPRLRLLPGAGEVVSDELPEGLLLVRATINLPGLRVGEHAFVDPEDDYMRDALRTLALVPVEPWDDPSS